MGIRNKVAFVHFQKAAGVYINTYLTRNVFLSDNKDMSIQGWKRFNPWAPPFDMKRDWKKSELIEIANNQFLYQQVDKTALDSHNSIWDFEYLERQYVHNHHTNWDLDCILEFQKNDWFVFSFIRDPAEIICSTYFWSQDQLSKGTSPAKVFKPAAFLELSLDGFIRSLLTDIDPHQRMRFTLPDYFHKLDFVAEFNDSNFRYFLKRFFDHEYEPSNENFNSSSNRGYKYYRENGEISDITHDLIQRDSGITQFRSLLGIY